jgi:hypothetical protein
MYARKACTALVYAGVWAALAHLVHLYHSLFLPAGSKGGILETISLSCVTNLVVGGLAMLAFAALRALQAVCQRPCYSYYCSAREPEAGQPVHISPPMVWCYVYTVGLGLFCLSYTLHGAHLLSSLCLCASALACSLWVVRRDDGLLPPKRVVLALVAALDASALGLCAYELRGTAFPWRNWACSCLGPLLAPWALAESRHKVRGMQVPGHHVVLFGLPFVGVLSTGYLSMYISLQQCAAEPWALLLAEHPSPLGLVVAALLVPCAGFAGLTVFAGAYHRPENLLACAHGLWLVVLGRRCWEEQAYLPAGILGLLAWLLCLLYLLVHAHLAEAAERWQRIVEGDLECLSEPAADDTADHMEAATTMSACSRAPPSAT